MSFGKRIAVAKATSAERIALLETRLSEAQAAKNDLSQKLAKAEGVIGIVEKRADECVGLLARALEGGFSAEGFNWDEWAKDARRLVGAETSPTAPPAAASGAPVEASVGELRAKLRKAAKDIQSKDEAIESLKHRVETDARAIDDLETKLRRTEIDLKGARETMHDRGQQLLAVNVARDGIIAEFDRLERDVRRISSLVATITK